MAHKLSNQFFIHLHAFQRTIKSFFLQLKNSVFTSFLMFIFYFIFELLLYTSPVVLIITYCFDAAFVKYHKNVETHRKTVHVHAHVECSCSCPYPSSCA